MNELEHDLENELRQLRPMAPSPQLAAGIAQQLNRSATAPGSMRRTRLALWTSWTLTAAAAAVAAAAWWPATPSAGRNESPSVVESEARVIPVGSSNVLLEARDEGIVVLDDGRAAHRVRLRYIDTVRLQDPSASSSIAVSRPREEVRFVPVNFY